MSKAIFSEPHFNDEDAARRHLEAIRWPDGPVCPHCGTIGRAYATKRPGKYRCAERECRKDFTATVGTLFERSHIPLTTWFRAVHLLTASKKGMSSHQMHRMLGVSYKTAWFMTHRIREAFRSGPLAPMGGEGQVVEADETYFGDKDEVTTRTIRGKSGHASKRSVVALVERGGSVRSFHVDRATKQTVTDIVKANVAREAELHTDESRLYGDAKRHVAAHHTVMHTAGEYVRGGVTTNTVEGVFSIFKRGMKGIYQHCGEKHLHRYLAEFDFRYNHRVALGIGDAERSERAIAGIGGKRLMYRDSSAAIV